VQLAVHGLTPEARVRWADEQKRRPALDFMVGAAPMSAEMGIGAGGTMRQEIYDDELPTTDYEPEGARLFVHLCSASQWRAITGEEPPVTPVSARAYTEAGLPWFDYYDADAADLPPTQALADVKPVGKWLGDDPELEGLVQPSWVIPTGPHAGAPVADGNW
jgi:hypothetical protein